MPWLSFWIEFNSRTCILDLKGCQFHKIFFIVMISKSTCIKPSPIYKLLWEVKFRNFLFFLNWAPTAFGFVFLFPNMIAVLNMLMKIYSFFKKIKHHVKKKYNMVHCMVVYAVRNSLNQNTRKGEKKLKSWCTVQTIKFYPHHTSSYCRAQQVAPVRVFVTPGYSWHSSSK